MAPNDYPELRRTYDQIEIAVVKMFYTTNHALRH